MRTKSAEVWTKVTSIERLLQGETIDAVNYLLLRAGGFSHEAINAHKVKTEGSPVVLRK